MSADINYVNYSTCDSVDLQWFDQLAFVRQLFQHCFELVFLVLCQSRFQKQLLGNQERSLGPLDQAHLEVDTAKPLVQFVARVLRVANSKSL